MIGWRTIARGVAGLFLGWAIARDHGWVAVGGAMAGLLFGLAIMSAIMEVAP